eukprot:5871923-Pleurochrysis_carterae.AAC.1
MPVHALDLCTCLSLAQCHPNDLACSRTQAHGHLLKSLRGFIYSRLPYFVRRWRRSSRPATRAQSTCCASTRTS